MLRKIVWFWNIVHYNIFIWENNLTKLLLYPFFKLLGSSKAKELYNKRGVKNAESLIKDALLNKENSSNSIRAGGIMGVIGLFICLSVFLIYTAFFEKKLNMGIEHLILFGVITFLINYYCLFKDKKYLLYFKEFNSLSKKDVTKYSWISFVFILLVLLFLIESFVFMDWRLHNIKQ